MSDQPQHGGEYQKMTKRKHYQFGSAVLSDLSYFSIRTYITQLNNQCDNEKLLI